jgi:transcriptional regulator with XRE-family HTH domain
MKLTREDLLKSNEYWKVQLQNDLYGIIEEYMGKHNLTRSDLAENLKVTKGYVTQILNGEFDHKLSKLVELALTCNKVPLTYYVDVDEFVKNDSLGKVYEVFPITRMQHVIYESKNPQPHTKPDVKISFDFQSNSLAIA